MSASTPATPSLCDLSVLKTRLCELLRYASLSRLIIHAATSEIRVKASEPGFIPGKILGTHMVLILVSGEALRLTFKLHFEMKTAKALASRIFGSNPDSPLADGQAIDYIKEYGNLIAGSVVTLMAPYGIELGISLPLSTRGFYEVFADYTEKNHPIVSYGDFWNLDVDGHEIHCSAHVEIMNREMIAGLADFSADDTVDDAEMDFL